MNPIDIDLLPWRERRREERRRRFFAGLAAAFVAAVAVVGAGWWWLDALLERQNSRNQFLEGAIANVEREIAEIKALEGLVAGIVGRKEVIEQLQIRRAEPILLVDSLPRLLPGGSALTLLERRDAQVSLHGLARSNGTVSEVMREIEASPYFRNVRLIETQSAEVAGRSAVRFALVTEIDRDEIARQVTAVPAAGSTGGGR